MHCVVVLTRNLRTHLFIVGMTDQEPAGPSAESSTRCFLLPISRTLHLDKSRANCLSSALVYFKSVDTGENIRHGFLSTWLSYFRDSTVCLKLISVLEARACVCAREREASLEASTMRANILRSSAEREASIAISPFLA